MVHVMNAIIIECDDKNRVPLAFVAANKQSPMCMGFETVSLKITPKR